jgi:predicted dehydrogenase
MFVDQPVRVGVIGAGVMGTRHARIYSELPDCRLTGIFDPDLDGAARVVDQFGGDVYHNLDDLLEAVDAVSIVSPTTTHAAVAHRVMDAGRHLLVEKPMTATLSEARYLTERARLSDLILLVGHVERFNPVVAELRRVLAGQPIHHATLRRIAPFNDRCLDTNVISDLMIHDIDLVRSLFGTEIETISADGEAVRTAQIDQAHVELTLDTGLHVSLIASRVGEVPTRDIAVDIDGAIVVADLLQRTISITSDERSMVKQFTVPAAEPLRLELQHFLNCIRGHATPLIDAAAGCSALEWADRIDSLIQQRSVAPLATSQAGG